MFRLKPLPIDTLSEHVIFIHEAAVRMGNLGFRPLDRVRVFGADPTTGTTHEVTGILNFCEETLVALDEIGLSAVTCRPKPPIAASSRPLWTGGSGRSTAGRWPVSPSARVPQPMWRQGYAWCGRWGRSCARANLSSRFTPRVKRTWRLHVPMPRRILPSSASGFEGIV